MENTKNPVPGSALPLSHLDEKVVRLVAAQVLLLAAVGAALGSAWPFAFLAVDFASRASGRIPSLLAAGAKTLARWASLEKKPIFAPPKRFAAGIGAVLSLALALAFGANLIPLAWSLALILLVCALLESALSICVGCYVYNFLLRFI